MYAELHKESKPKSTVTKTRARSYIYTHTLIYVKYILDILSILNGLNEGHMDEVKNQSTGHMA